MRAFLPLCRLLLAVFFLSAPLALRAQYTTPYGSAYRPPVINNSYNYQQQAANQQMMMMGIHAAALTRAVQLDLLQRYSQDDTAMALIRMFKRKRGSGWPWLVGGTAAGMTMMLTSFRKDDANQIGGYTPTRVSTGQLIGGSVVMMAGYLGYFLTGARYNFERLTEVLIAREQHRPIPVRYLQQLKPRDFSPFHGEVLK